MRHIELVKVNLQEILVLDAKQFRFSIYKILMSKAVTHESCVLGCIYYFVKYVNFNTQELYLMSSVISVLCIYSVVRE